MYRLRCSVQSYDWGKPATTSIVARLKQLNASSCSGSDQIGDADAQKPYAEFWMGTHKNGPSFVQLNGQEKAKEILLSEYVSSNQAALGEIIQRKFADQGEEAAQLPFLFKVLSVNKALSIQIHPDKPTARELRKDFPNLYPDDNHKPEMAVAIGDFECMCAFRPAQEIAHFLTVVSELRTLIGESACNDFVQAVAKDTEDAQAHETVRATLSECFKALMGTDQDALAKAVHSHIKHIGQKRQKQESGTAESASLSGDQEEALFERLFSFYGVDVGCFAVYFLNTLRLRDGEAVFLGANLPHCYLFGDCAEIMACSDNVVRAGLTPKCRDVATLCRLVDCSPLAPNAVRFAFEEHQEGSLELRSYVPPVDDFALERFRVTRTALQNADVHIDAADSAAVLLLLNGDCVLETTYIDSHTSTLYAHAGTCLFLPVGTKLTIKHKANVQGHSAQPDQQAFWHVDPDTIILFRAFCQR